MPSQRPLAASLAPAIIMSCSEVLPFERRALAEMTGDVGVTFSGGHCWKSLSSVMWLTSGLVTLRSRAIQIHWIFGTVLHTFVDITHRL